MTDTSLTARDAINLLRTHQIKDAIYFNKQKPHHRYMVAMYRTDIKLLAIVFFESYHAVHNSLVNVAENTVVTAWALHNGKRRRES